MDIIDCHIHPVLNPDDDIACYDSSSGTPEQQMKALQKAGITHACGSVLARRDMSSFEPIIELNDAAFTLRDRLAGFYFPGVHIHPAYPEESCRELERCHANGARWIGELVGYWMDHDYPTNRMQPILQMAGKLQMPVNLHISSLERLSELCRSTPETNLVLAHPGDGKDCRERIATVAAHDNLYLDLSGTGVMRLGMVGYAVNQAGAHKILLGSDFPICNPAMYIECVRYENLGTATQEAIFSGNFRRLVNLNSRKA